jgi:hypothetical protein
MAEIAGLVVGVVSLAAAVHDCVDLLTCISAIRSFDHDGEIVSTKLDIQKLRLLQWSERVGFVKWADEKIADAPAKDQPARACAKRIVTSLFNLLIDGNTLQQRYGLRASNDNPIVLAKRDEAWPTERLGQHRMEAFLVQFREQMRFMTYTDSEEKRSKKLAKRKSLILKARWAILDKAKFEGLVTDVSQLVDGLHNTMPDQAREERMMDSDIKLTRNVRTLKLVVDAAAGSFNFKHIGNVAQNALFDRAVATILDALWLPCLREREAAVGKAHARTFDWALESPPDCLWEDLSHWFEAGDNIYWVQGKPGSGKSTLMKHIIHHEKTDRLLQRWSKDAALTKAKFFFWGLGTPEQKSQRGLCRSLLYQFLTSNHDLVPMLLPHMWQDIYRSEATTHAPVSVAETSDAFGILADLKMEKRRLCLFVDGLDEFEGNIAETIEMFRQLGANPSIKLLISSRPIPQCSEAFKNMPNLRLQDLTRSDIAVYINDTVLSHRYVSQLESLYPGSVATITAELQEKACGVFLWVILACRSLLQGFASYDRLEDLKLRIDELPPELEELFRHILESMNKLYRRQAARLLHIVYSYEKTQPIAHLPAISLAVFEESGLDISNVGPFKKLSETERAALLVMFRGRLMSRCCGLLEVIDMEIHFMHRTVFEFLMIPGNLGSDYLQVADGYFDPHAVIAGISLHAGWLDGEHQSLDAPPHLEDMVTHAALAEASAYENLLAIFHRCDQLKILTSSCSLDVLMCESDGELDKDDFNILNDPEDVHPFNMGTYLTLAVESGMTAFLQVHNEIDPITNYVASGRDSLVFHALLKPYLSKLHMSGLQCDRNTVATLKLLVEIGLDCSEVFDEDMTTKKTMWETWLTHITPEPFLALSVTEVLLLLSRRKPAPNISSKISDWVKSIRVSKADSHFGTSSQPQTPLEQRQMVARILRVLEQGRIIGESATGKRKFDDHATVGDEVDLKRPKRD